MPVAPSHLLDAEPWLALGREAGLDVAGVAEAVTFSSTRDDLEQRRAEGLHGGMAFTYRNPARATDAGALVPGARALVVGARSYRRRPPAAPDGRGPLGEVARYAWDDHYGALRRALDAVAAALRADGWRARLLVDDNALVDREAARRAGLGWYGKNANLLLPGQGSWFVLGSVATDAPLRPAEERVADGCGTCRRCLDGCPTDAIVAPGVVDARRCLAWLVQAPGSFPEEHRAALGARIYGCDDCQEVCPPNRVADRADAPAGDGEQAWVPLLDLLAASDEALLERHGRWYVAERDPRHLRRNALVALGNVARPGDDEVVAVLRRVRGGDDPMLAEHAAWAEERLGERQRVDAP